MLDAACSLSERLPVPKTSPMVRKDALVHALIDAVVAKHKSERRDFPTQ